MQSNARVSHMNNQVQLTGIRHITLVGSVANLILSGAKLTVGTLSSSQALIADGVHSLSDLATDLAVWIGARLWTAPADRRHPYGHGRIETLVNLFIALALGSVALGIAWEAISTIHDTHGAPPGWWAFAVAIFSLFVKEALYRWTAWHGRLIRSSAVIANAWHHRSDALSSIPVALAVIAGHVSPNLTAVDHVAALIVSLMLLKATWDIGWPCVRELTEENSCRDIEDCVHELAIADPTIAEVHAIRCKRLGSMFAIDLHLLVTPSMPVAEAHAVADGFERSLMDRRPDVIDVLVHIEPYRQIGDPSA
jgi:cation diffusion facilitator family transporter